MSTCLLNHAFGIRGYQYTRTDYQGGQTISSIHQDPRPAVAPPADRHSTLARPGRAPLPILAYRRPRDVQSPAHPARRMSGLPRRAPGEGPLRRSAGSYTSCFERYSLELGRRMTIRDVAVHLGVGWDRRRDDNTVTQHRFHCPAEHCRACSLRERCVRDPEKGRTVRRLEGEELIEAQKEWIETVEAKAANRLRGSVIERCLGGAKQHRDLRRLQGRGLKRAEAEIGLVILVQTALTLARLRKNAATPKENAA